ncbi:MAG TPA: DNA topoisomerase IB [Stellaceae bacterium]|nr:DNA topoisomerase IB [Stellaceae bacterium]
MALDPVDAADAAGLHYINPEGIGIRRLPSGRGFLYRDAAGKLIHDETILARIRSLAIPPAYRDVWISKSAKGHIQAVGRDARGRKQYRYHPQWNSVRDAAKYGKLLLFAHVLPQIRARVDHDLALPGLPKEKVLAAIVRLLERTLARVGNKEYAKTNKSYGLTTLRNRHVRVKGRKIVFDFRAKHGIQRHIDLEDQRLARIVKKCQELPGQELFGYLAEDDTPRRIASDDVNAYLREITGQDITAKDFRTWAGTKLAVVALRQIGGFESAGDAKKNVLRAIEAVAKMLGNTPAICRKCYIHPAILDGYSEGKLEPVLMPGRGRARRGLSADEIVLVRFLKAAAKP